MLHAFRSRYIQTGWLIITAILAAAITGCATETHRTLVPETVATHNTAYNGPRYVLMVGKFQNRSSYMQGIFSNGLDQLGNQAKTILKTHLQMTNRFAVVDRLNMEEIAREANLRGETQSLKGAQVTITGDVT